MYPINVSFKDILRTGTADSSFSFICTGLVHNYVHVFLQVFVHSFFSFTTPLFLSNTLIRVKISKFMLIRGKVANCAAIRHHKALGT